MSNTPETDKAVGQWNCECHEVVQAWFARRLERERDEARKDAERLATLLDEPMRISGMDWPTSGWHEAAQSALAAHEALAR